MCLCKLHVGTHVYGHDSIPFPNVDMFQKVFRKELFRTPQATVIATNYNVL